MKIKSAIFTALLITAVFFPALTHAQTACSDFWTATDALGRKLPTYQETGARKTNKYVAMFYWIWHQGNDPHDIKNITEIVRQYPEAMKDYNHPAWGNKRPGFFFWEQPLLGYYKTTDEWVLRKHAEMLADAGVDVVFFDCTNADFTFKQSYEALMKTWDKAQKDGVNVPKIAFMLPFGPMPNSLSSLHKLYRDIYQPARYPNLWFMWKGKPCIMAYPDNLSNSEEDRAIASFFTFRPGQPDYVDGPKRNDQWGWLEMYPQHGYAPTAGGGFEETTVGVAQNACPSSNGHCSAFNMKDAYGRNFSVTKGFDPRIDGYLYGWNFQEQWDRAREIDPELVFVTGWNEFTAGQWLPQHGWHGDPFSFVDEYNWNCSRDIEPVKGWGDMGDVYYMQLTANVRKFKGMRQQQPVSPMKTIRLQHTADWADVAPFFAAYKGNTLHRDAKGRGSRHYTNNTGRNDITGAKVARDARNLYFYVQTANKITRPQGHHWMMLLIDTDRNKATGWNGYDFAINRLCPQNGKAIVERNYKGKWMWNHAATVNYSLQGNTLVIAIPRSLLGLENKLLNFEFKWNDNMQDEGNIMDFYVNGDTAPAGRFNYLFSE